MTRDGWEVSYDADADRGFIKSVEPLPTSVIHSVQFQHGPIGDNGVNGIQNEELLELLLIRLRALQERFPCRENALAITNIEQGLMWLQRRTALRVAQGVEGQNVAHVS